MIVDWQMEYNVSGLDKENILEITVSGEKTGRNAKKITLEVINIVNNSQLKKILIDIRKAKGRFSITDAYFFVRSFPLNFPKVKVAVVDLQENIDFYSFFETIFINRGIQVNFFNNLDEANKFLAEY